MKLLFVTGGVMSGLGKGITAASVGKLMKSCGYSVTMMKLDPYLQIDAGTMSPFEHGETFVTKDGFETDLDLGHYERFIDEDLTKESSVTTGQIYLSVIQQERQGKFLGKTVQVIPHITNEIKSRIQKVAQKKDLTIIEIGGTVGDIEGPHFIEAMRQLRNELGKSSVMNVHVVPVLEVTTSGELKTKAIQHSVIKLREMGISPDCLVCRSRDQLQDDIKQKLSLFCDLPLENIISAPDKKSIYAVPQQFAKEGITNIIQKTLFDHIQLPDLQQRNQNVETLLHPTKHVNIAIAGKYTHLDDSYLSVIEALNHAGIVFDAKVHIHRIDTEQYESQDWEQNLTTFLKNNNIQGVVVPGGFGSRGIEGKINIASFCRRNTIPYLGLCLGLQVATIAFARDVCGLGDLTPNLSFEKKKNKISQVNSTEFCQTAQHPVITIMHSQKNITDKGGTMRLGHYPAKLSENSLVKSLYQEYGQHLFTSSDSVSPDPSGSGTSSDSSIVGERHRHRYEVNPKYHDILQQHGLILSGRSPDGNLVEFIEYHGRNAGVKNGGKGLKEVERGLKGFEKSTESQTEHGKLKTKNWINGTLDKLKTKNSFYVATQAHPELQSRFARPHPLFVGLIQSVVS